MDVKYSCKCYLDFAYFLKALWQHDITKTRLFKYIENLPPKNENFQMKNSGSFHISISAQKHWLWVLVRTASAGAVLMYTHNLCFWAEIRKLMYSPVNPCFTVLKWGLMGSKL